MGKWFKSAVWAALICLPIALFLLVMESMGVSVLAFSFWSFEGLFLMYAFIFYNIFMLIWK